MGWTHTGGGAGAMLQLYPTLASIPVLLDRWPGLREAVAAQEAKRKEDGKATPTATPATPKP